MDRTYLEHRATSSRPDVKTEGEFEVAIYLQGRRRPDYGHDITPREDASLSSSAKKCQMNCNVSVGSYPHPSTSGGHRQK